jgi:serine/threonine-protein kinase HipA
MSIELIKVRAWGSLVGAVVLDPQRNFYAFQYDPTWAQKGIELAPRMMPVRDPQAFLFTNLDEATFHRLPGMLADAMPDHFGNALINACMTQRGMALESVSTLESGNPGDPQRPIRGRAWIRALAPQNWFS